MGSSLLLTISGHRQAKSHTLTKAMRWAVLILLCTAFSESALASEPRGTAHSIDVVIRYAAVIDDEAQHPIIKNYAKRIPGSKKQEAITQDTIGVFRNMLVKTSYFAQELYIALSSKLADRTIILQPMAVSCTQSGDVALRPLSNVSVPPASLIIDFFTYSYPSRADIIENRPQTFGGTVTPLVTIRTSPEAAPATGGLLAVSEPLLYTGTFDPAGPADMALGHTLIDYLTASADSIKRSPKVASDQKAAVPNEVTVFKFEETSLDMEALNLMLGLGAARNGDVAMHIWASRVEGVVDQALSAIDEPVATLAARRVYYAEFDPELAGKIPLTPTDPATAARIKFLQDYEALEIATLKKLSDLQIQRIFLGQIGNDIRQTINAEQKFWQEKKTYADQQSSNATMAMGFAFLGIAGAATGQNQALAQTNMMQAEQFASKADDATASQAQLAESFNANFSGVYQSLFSEAQAGTGIDAGKAGTLGEVRKKAEAKYADLFGKVNRAGRATCSLSVWFDHKIQRSGNWEGACEEGRASGYGHAVFLDEGRFAGSYLGEARDGIPDGWGYQVAVDKGEQFGDSYLGKFVDGKLNGVVRYNHSGKPEAIRDFKDGRDDGGESGKGRNEFMASLASSWANAQQQTRDQIASLSQQFDRNLSGSGTQTAGFPMPAPQQTNPVRLPAASTLVQPGRSNKMPPQTPLYSPATDAAPQPSRMIQGVPEASAQSPTGISAPAQLPPAPLPGSQNQPSAGSDPNSDPFANWQFGR